MASSRPFEITVNTDSWPSKRTFIGGPAHDFYLDANPLEQRRDGSLPDRVYDLLRVASSIYLCDLAVRRRSKNRPNGWRRNIELSVQVTDPGFWNGDRIASGVNELVQSLTGDNWSTSFRQLPGEQRQSERQPHFEFDSVASAVCLYSGGLDSASRMQEEPNAWFTPVTVGHRSDIRSTTVNQLESLTRLFGRRLLPISVGFHNHLRRLGLKSEPSQRSRALLFMAVAAAVAAINETEAIEAYESGVGAINAPLLAGMRASQSTRGLHPETIRLASNLLSDVLDRPIRIALPFAGMTKGAVLRQLNGRIDSLAVSTISCVHYPNRHIPGAGHLQCGVCPACLFRRVAMASAGVNEPRGVYRYDLLDPRTEVSAKKRRPLLAFLNQVDSIHAAGESQLPAAIRAHLHAAGVVESDDDTKLFATLYRQYAADWDEFIRQGRRNGCSWPNLIDARSAA